MICRGPCHPQGYKWETQQDKNFKPHSKPSYDFDKQKLGFEFWKPNLSLRKHVYLQQFQTRFLEEADKFIASLDKKAAKKVLYNIDFAEQSNDPKLF